jgi:hypothetical protein
MSTVELLVGVTICGGAETIVGSGFCMTRGVELGDGATSGGVDETISAIGITGAGCGIGFSFLIFGAARGVAALEY